MNVRGGFEKGKGQRDGCVFDKGFSVLPNCNYEKLEKNFIISKSKILGMI